jgi:chemotaxis response regulator CheB
MQMFGRRVLIFSSSHLFAQAVRHLVEGSGLNVVGLEPYSDEAAERIQRLQPDIIILNDTQLSPLQLTSLLDYAPTVRVIRIEMDGDLITVYDRHELNAHAAQDFVNTLKMPEGPGR